jgi:hypothetical protein
LFAGALTTSDAYSRSNINQKYVSEVPSVEINLSVIEELRRKEAAKIEAEKADAFTLESKKLQDEKKNDLKKRQKAYLEKSKPELISKAKNIPQMGYLEKKVEDKVDDVENIFPEYRSKPKALPLVKVPVRKPVTLSKESEAEKIAKAEKAAEAERIAKAEKAAEAERVAKAEKAAEAERISKAEKVAEAERIAKAEKAAEAERIAKAEKAAETERIAKAEKAAEAERIAKAEKEAKNKPAKMLLVVPVLKPKNKEEEKIASAEIDKKQEQIATPEIPEVKENPNYVSSLDKMEADSEGYLEVPDHHWQGNPKDIKLADNNILDEAKKIVDEKKPFIDNSFDDSEHVQEIPKDEIKQNVVSEVSDKTQKEEKSGLFSVFSKIAKVKNLFSGNKDEKKEPEEIAKQDVSKELNEEKKVAEPVTPKADIGLEELPKKLPPQKEEIQKVETAKNNNSEKFKIKVVQKKDNKEDEQNESKEKNIFAPKKSGDIFASNSENKGNVRRTTGNPAISSDGSVLTSKALIPVEVEELDEISDAAKLRNDPLDGDLQVAEHISGAVDSNKTPYYVTEAQNDDLQIILPNELEDDFENAKATDSEQESVEKETNTANSGGVLYLEDIAESLKKQKNSKDKLDNSISVAVQNSKVTELASLGSVVPSADSKNGADKSKIETISLLQISFKADELTVDKADEHKITEFVSNFKNKKNKLEIVSYANGEKPEEAKRISLKRAIAVRKHLIYAGLNSDRFVVKIAGEAKSKADANSVRISLIK